MTRFEGMASAAAAPAKHPVSQLQEVCQTWKLPLPTYRECEGSYQAFGTEVTVQLNEGDKICYKALGRTKKASKTNAAQLVLDHIIQHKPELLEKPQLPEVRLMKAKVKVHAFLSNRLSLVTKICLLYGRKV